MIVSGGYERSSINGYVQGFDICIKDAFRISALSNASKIPLNDWPKEYNLAFERVSNSDL